MGEAEQNEFEIGGHHVPACSSSDISIPITTLATGYSSMLSVRVFHGAEPGPTVFVSGAVHGDEIVGTAVIQHLAQQIDPSRLSGTVLLVPATNIFGFLNRSRYLPDRRDLNR